MTKARFGELLILVLWLHILLTQVRPTIQQRKLVLKRLAVALQKKWVVVGITVNSVAPGFIATEMTEQLSEDIRKKMSDQVALNRLGDPQDIANAVSFLASDKANYITGTVMHVNGGLYMS